MLQLGAKDCLPDYLVYLSRWCALRLAAPTTVSGPLEMHYCVNVAAIQLPWSIPKSRHGMHTVVPPAPRTVMRP